MCGRFSQTADVKELAARFGYEASDVTFAPRCNIAPGQEAPVVIWFIATA
ncbi:MAG: SOS response-associated peptidase family protein [Elusimicrobia bacterium]|nr:SOS response-associated peptidase family protein [Elusimicrobiota bacterium]